MPQIPAPAPSASSPSAAHATPALDKANLKTFFAGLVPYALHHGDVAGGTLAVVKDGKIIFAGGYGEADTTTHAPVVADRTLFRVGSVSKLFVWTAVMQLVQAGKIDLNANVDTYLDFKIPPAFGKPVTMRDLMTHTPGFADVDHDLFMTSASQLYPLRRYLVRNMPPRIFAPGTTIAYSNYGAALAGYIVQRVSGEPFDHYVDTHIFKPLDMNHASFAQPLPTRLKPDMSKGYVTASKGPTVPFEAVEAYPAGAMSATATDMAHFMIAQLQQGRYEGSSILSPTTARMMQSTQYLPAPGMNGMDLGFIQMNRNGRVIFGHEGDTGVFHSLLALIPKAGVGIFMSFNSRGKNASVASVRSGVYHRFLDHFFPYARPQARTLPDAKKDAARVAGWYAPTRRNDLGISKLGQLPVKALPDGMISVKGAHYQEVAPLEYRRVGGQERLKFVAGKNGRIRYWVSSTMPVWLNQRVHGLRQMGVVLPMILFTEITLLLTLLIGFGGWWVRRHYRQRLDLDRGAARLRLASRVGAVLLLLSLSSWTLVQLLSQASRISEQMATVYSLLIPVYVIGVLGLAGAVAILAEALHRIIKGPGGFLCRIGEALLGLSAVYGIWFILTFGLASFNMHF